MMRLDKYLTENGIGSRSQVKEYIKKGFVTINDQTCRSADIKIDENTDHIQVNGDTICYQQFHYYMLHKPQGVVTATRDNHDKTVLDLLDPSVIRKDLFPVGRLDKDTEGLLLISDDGELAHKLLSPRHHVDKTYFVKLKTNISEEALQRLEQGLDIGEDKRTLPAKVEKLEETIILLTIQEGKFHQVKRMLQAVDNEVIYLKRLTFGSLKLDETLAPGQYRPLTNEEIIRLKTDSCK